MSSKSIVNLSKKFDTDKKMNDGIKCRNGVLGHNYAIHYDNMLLNKSILNMMEIGVSWGSSIRMWDEYFNSKVNIYGIDINEYRFKKKDLEKNNITILIGNQSDTIFLKQVENVKFDLIIDDGSHRMSHQQISLGFLFKTLNSGGIYVIEDLHTSNHKHFYDSNPETTTIDLLKNLSLKRNVPNNYLSSENIQYLIDNILDIEFYENNTIAFIEKK